MWKWCQSLNAKVNENEYENENEVKEKFPKYMIVEILNMFLRVK